MTFCSLVAGAAGGMAGGAMLVLWPFINLTIAKGFAFDAFFMALSLNLGAAVIFALFGTVFGAIFGFLPAFFSGFSLIVLSRWRPFQSLILWTLIGAIAGLVTGSLFSWKSPLDSIPAWVFGGAAAMMAYWALGLRLFKLRLATAL